MFGIKNIIKFIFMNFPITIRFSILVLVLNTINCDVFAQQKTYCNPINIDYGYCPIPNFSAQGKHRATASTIFSNDHAAV